MSDGAVRDVRRLELLMAQPSPCWAKFGLDELKVYGTSAAAAEAAEAELGKIRAEVAGAASRRAATGRTTQLI